MRIEVNFEAFLKHIDVDSRYANNAILWKTQSSLTFVVKNAVFCTRKIH